MFIILNKSLKLSDPLQSELVTTPALILRCPFAITPGSSSPLSMLDSFFPADVFFPQTSESTYKTGLIITLNKRN